jgi:hypothetical protein
MARNSDDLRKPGSQPRVKSREPVQVIKIKTFVPHFEEARS